VKDILLELIAAAWIEGGESFGLLGAISAVLLLAAVVGAGFGLVVGAAVAAFGWVVA